MRLLRFASWTRRACAVLGAGLLLLGISSSAAPPFSGTIFIDGDIITETDPTAFEGLDAAGRGMRTMFDRRVNGWVNLNAFLFNARYDDGLVIEVQVNPEFGSEESARAEVLTYAKAAGHLPTTLRKDVRTMWIHQGQQPFGGGNNNLLIHIGQAADYVRNGILEETLMHEAAHTSLDAEHARAAGWVEAQAKDGEFISTYARDNPTREDVAESFLPYFALRYKADRISQSLSNTIASTIPARIAYFDAQPLALNPVRDPVPLAVTSWSLLPAESALRPNGVRGLEFGTARNPRSTCAIGPTPRQRSRERGHGPRLR